MEGSLGFLEPESIKKQSTMFLVTGGTGFLGLHLISLLLQEGFGVRAISRNPPTHDEMIEGVEYVTGSVSDLRSLEKACVGVDGIFHLAGLVVHSRLPQFQEELYQTNVVGTLNVLQAAHTSGCRRVVYASTSGTIGCSRNPNIIPDDSPYCFEIAKNWPYYATKIESEIRGKEFAKEHGIDFIMMRPSVMLGPGDMRFRSTHFILSFLDGGVPVIPPGGYSFVDVRDAAAAFCSAMKSGRGNEGYLLAASNPTISDFLSLLSEVSGQPKPRILLPPPVIIPLVKGIDYFNRKIKGEWKSSMDPVRSEMSIHYWGISSNKAKVELGFRPRDPKQTVIDTVNWMQQNRDRYGHPSPTSRARL